MAPGFLYSVVAFYALLGRAQAIAALALACLVGMLNPALVELSGSVSTWRWLVIAAAAVSVAWRSGAKYQVATRQPLVAPTLLLGTFFVCHAFFFSEIVDLSVLKATSWTVATVTLFVAWGGLGPAGRERTARLVHAGLVLVMLASAPFLVHPSGYFRNGTGFQGILSHPQTFGVIVALLGIWTLADMVASARPSWKQMAICGLSAALVFASESRTAGLSMTVGIAIAVSIAVKHGGSIRNALPGLSRRWVQWMTVALLTGLVAAAPQGRDLLVGFLQKRNDVAGIGEIFRASRGNIVDVMQENIVARPWTGLGFGIGSDTTEMTIERDPVWGIPVSGAVEKGVLPVAILEEVGIPGLLVTAFWVYLLIAAAVRSGLQEAAVAICGILLNFGESMLFSPGGIGLLVLVMLTWASTGQRCDARGSDIYADCVPSQ